MTARYNDDAINELTTFFKGRNEGWTPIAQYTVGAGGVASYTFAAIPQVYRQLVILANLRTDRASTSDIALYRLNADAGNNYDRQYYGVNNATFVGAVVVGGSVGYFGFTEAANSAASTFGMTYIVFNNYTNTSMHKWSISHTSAYGTPAVATTNSYTMTSKWRSTNAITSIQILPNTGPNFVQNSILQLYGVL